MIFLWLVDRPTLSFPFFNDSDFSLHVKPTIKIQISLFFVSLILQFRLNNERKKKKQRRIFSSRILFVTKNNFSIWINPLETTHTISIYISFSVLVSIISNDFSFCVIRSSTRNRKEKKRSSVMCVNAMPALTELDKLKNIQSVEIESFPPFVQFTLYLVRTHKHTHTYAYSRSVGSYFSTIAFETKTDFHSVNFPFSTLASWLLGWS